MGTWEVEYVGGQYWVYDEDGRFVMNTNNRRVADLVAAAPKLLAACEALPLEAATFDDAADFIDHAGSFRNAMDLAQPAIREARGEAE